MPKTLLDQPFGPGQTKREVRSKRLQRSGQVEPIRVATARGPWGGYAPDIEGTLLGFKDARNVDAIMSYGRRPTSLLLDDGWTRLEVTGGGNESLPLGATAATHGPPADAGMEEPVIGIKEFTELDGTVRLFAVTAARSEAHGHVYEWVDGAPDAWTERPHGLARDLANSVAGETMDMVYFPFPDGAAIRATTTGRGVVVFTNGVDVPYIFRTVAADAYDDLQQLAGGAAVVMTSISTIANYNDRCMMFGVEEGGTDLPFRLRWTSIGTLDWDPATAGVGTGAVDLDSLEEPGVGMKPIGDAVACYFGDGVMLIRKTGQSLRPFEVEQVQKTRGLIGRHAVVNVGAGVHFGLFTDGFYFFDQNGQWREAGTLQLKGMEQGRRVRKFTETFFSELHPTWRTRIEMYWDHTRRLVRVAWPDTSSGGGLNRVWNYHVDTDTMWPDNQYNPDPSYWGSGTVFDSTTTTWANVIGSWDNIDGRWADLIATGFEDSLHGTGAGANDADGLVLIRTPFATEREGVNPSWFYESHLADLGTPSIRKRVAKGVMEYVSKNTSPNINLGVNTEDGTASSALVTPTKGATGTRQKDYVTSNSAGEQLGMEVSGATSIEITGLELHFVVEGDEVRTRGG